MFVVQIERQTYFSNNFFKKQKINLQRKIDQELQV